MKLLPMEKVFNDEDKDFGYNFIIIACQELKFKIYYIKMCKEFHSNYFAVEFLFVIVILGHTNNGKNKKRFGCINS